MTGKEETGIFTLYSDVEATAVRWLWYPFIAVGKITLLQGDPGDGKSTMMMNLIAELSKGGTMPDGKQVGIPQKIITSVRKMMLRIPSSQGWKHVAQIVGMWLL